jgi:hypothetical protein
MLYAVSFLPGSLRRATVRLIEGVRKDGAGRLFGRAAASLRKRLAGRLSERPSAGISSAPKGPVVKH